MQVRRRPAVLSQEIFSELPPIEVVLPIAGPAPGQHRGSCHGATPDRELQLDTRVSIVPPFVVSPRVRKVAPPQATPPSGNGWAVYTPPHAAMAIAGSYPPHFLGEPPVSANAGRVGGKR
jgi:hypothetical protein